jgi:transposase
MSHTQQREFARRCAFVQAVQREVLSLARLCQTFDISRQTAYRWLSIYRREGLDGLAPKAASRAGIRTSLDVVELVVHLRREFGWGAARIRRYMEGAAVTPPSPRTINNILHQHNQQGTPVG